jgi:hypothetical protein
MSQYNAFYSLGFILITTACSSDRKSAPASTLARTDPGSTTAQITFEQGYEFIEANAIFELTTGTAGLCPKSLTRKVSSRPDPQYSEIKNLNLKSADSAFCKYTGKTLSISFRCREGYCLKPTDLNLVHTVNIHFSVPEAKDIAAWRTSLNSNGTPVIIYPLENTEDLAQSFSDKMFSKDLLFFTIRSQM